METYGCMFGVNLYCHFRFTALKEITSSDNQRNLWNSSYNIKNYENKTTLHIGALNLYLWAFYSRKSARLKTTFDGLLRASCLQHVVEVKLAECSQPYHQRSALRRHFTNVITQSVRDDIRQQLSLIPTYLTCSTTTVGDVTYQGGF